MGRESSVYTPATEGEAFYEARFADSARRLTESGVIGFLQGVVAGRVDLRMEKHITYDPQYPGSLASVTIHGLEYPIKGGKVHRYLDVSPAESEQGLDTLICEDRIVTDTKTGLTVSSASVVPEIIHSGRPLSREEYLVAKLDLLAPPTQR